MFGFDADDWEAWNSTETIDGVQLIGPFNRDNVKASGSYDLSNAVMARNNGHWSASECGLLLGTCPGCGNADSEGIARRYHHYEGYDTPYVGDEYVPALWYLWLR